MSLQVSVVNPARIKHYGESKLHRNKSLIRRLEDQKANLRQEINRLKSGDLQIHIDLQERIVTFKGA